MNNPCAEVEIPMRAWCVRVQYESKKQFYFGTVHVRYTAGQHEVEAECLKAIDEVFPTRPKVLDVIPGAVWFAPEEKSAVA